MPAPERLVCVSEVRFQGAVKMGNVEMILKLMPQSPDIDLEEVKVEIKEKLPETRDMQEEPIGFGLSALKVLVVVPDEAGATDRVEDTLKAINGIESVDIIHTSLS
jgi:elongation factor 1-beta